MTESTITFVLSDREQMLTVTEVSLLVFASSESLSSSDSDDQGLLALLPAHSVCFLHKHMSDSLTSLLWDFLCAHRPAAGSL